MHTFAGIGRLMGFLALLALLPSCGEYDPNDQVGEGVVEKNIYTSHEIGWTIKIPGGWTVVSKDRLQEVDEKGLGAIENVLEEAVDLSGLKHLISFSKDDFNVFQSTSEPFQVEYEGEWEQNNEAIKDLILAAYEDQGISAEGSEITLEDVDGLSFQKYELTVYGPSGDVILNQLMYSRLINGFDFGVNLNYNNEVDKNAMLEAWRNSEFGVRTDP